MVGGTEAIGFGLIVTILAFIVYVLDLGERIIERWRWLIDRLTPDLMDDIFGPEVDIEYLDRHEFEARLKEAVDSASRSVDRISIHAYTVDQTEGMETLESENIEQRFLFLKPDQDANTGEISGIESIRRSRLDPDDLTTDDKFEKEFEHFYNHLNDGNWSAVEARVYETTPWLRGVIVDDRMAGFIIVPSLYDGRKAAKFWSEDPEVVGTISSIYDDIWTDERTVNFEDWYSNWKEQEE